jgi:F0F1-type ATP synthase alpha subunit
LYFLKVFYFFLFPKIFRHVGFIRTVSDGIVTIFGLDSVRYGEMILFSNHEVGVILSLENTIAAAIVLGSDIKLIPGDFVFRTQKLMGIFVSGALLGSIVNPLGRSLSKSKVDNYRFLAGKYINFKDLFSIFFVILMFLKIFLHLILILI